jgi:hypothetical protein
LLSDHFPGIIWLLNETGVESVSHGFAEALGKKKADSLQDVEQEEEEEEEEEEDIPCSILLWFYLRQAILRSEQ